MSVFNCINCAVERRVPFHANTALNSVPAADDFADGRIIGLSVDGVYEIFTFARGVWRGPCLTLTNGFSGTNATEGCDRYRVLTNTWPTGYPAAAVSYGAKSWVFDIPEAHRLVVPWAP